MRSPRWLLAACALSLLALPACGSKADRSGTGRAEALTPGEGTIPVTGGKVWYRVVGSGDRTPLLVLHGGPGIPSQYLNPLAALGDERPVIFYDQLGAGRSDASPDTALWTLDHYVQEVGEVRKALGLDKVAIYGHSWGSMLAVDYTLAHPEGVECLILGGPALSIPRWQADAETLLATLPDSVRQTVRENEAAGTTDSPAYQNAMGVFYSRYLARKQPWSADIDSSFAQMNPAIYGYMEGPSEFTLTGTIRNYDRTPELGQLQLPVLFLIGQYDEVRPVTAAYYQSLVEGAKLVTIPGAGHLAMQDKPQEYVAAMRTFLDAADAQAK